jgi:hypothetical protein
MDSPQSVVSPIKSSSAPAEPDHISVNNLVGKYSEIEVRGKENGIRNSEASIGVLDVYIHEARDIHNICIYQKQDVYAKLFLTTDTDTTVSTQIINGGGQNPVFNEHLQLNIRSVDSLLKCEIWMLSRVRNYLEDQLLGVASVPLSEVVLKNGTLNKEFSLSSNDIFHSQAGYVQLSLSYSGPSPEVMAVPAPVTVEPTDAADSLSSKVSEFDKMEFPDPNIVNENHMMVSEYYGIPCSDLDMQNTEKETVDNVENPSTEMANTAQIPRPDSPRSSVSTDGSASVSVRASYQSPDTTEESSKEKSSESGAAEQKLVQKDAFLEPVVNVSVEAEQKVVQKNAFIQPAVNVSIEAEQKVVQQDYVDMYMKSMQQFTESLAKMALPLEVDGGQTSSTDSSSGQKSQTTPKSTGSRVFYGSRAFF